MAQDKIIPGPWKNAPNIKQGGGSGHGGNGGGGAGAVDLRIGTLETHVDYVKRDVADIRAASETIRNDVTSARIQLGQLVERVSHLPSKGFILTGVMSALAMLTALIAFQQQIQRVLGLH